MISSNKSFEDDNKVLRAVEETEGALKIFKNKLKEIPTAFSAVKLLLFNFFFLKSKEEQMGESFEELKIKFMS